MVKFLHKASEPTIEIWTITASIRDSYHRLPTDINALLGL